MAFDVQGSKGGVATRAKEMALGVLAQMVEFVAEVAKTRGVVASNSPVAPFNNVGTECRP